ncbi:MAG TPA: sensor histidine kinase [Anaerolineales bacterium]|nr:sensor histidine kinase [Anaerolineales bacterium]
MKTLRLEPGLLTIFRLFLIAQFALMFVNLHVHSARGFLEGNVRFGYLFAVGGTLGLLVYLSIPWLEKQLDRLYLPVALIYSTVFSLVAHYLFLTTHTGRSSEENAWQFFLFLCIPLVLISWQYGFKSVVAYCLFITFLDTLLASQIRADFELYEFTYHRLSFIRFLSFLIVGYVISRIMQQLRAERQALQTANRKLENHLVTLEQLTVSRERNRVARELHDTLTHTLSGVAVQLEAVDSLWTSDRKQARDLLRHSLRATRDGLTETRNAIQSLRAAPLADLGLARALRDFAETTAARTGLQVEFDLSNHLDGLPLEVEQCFYRIGQEAIENIARHAQAKCVKVKLSGNASRLCLQVSDDGSGFDLHTSESGRHFGLQGMRERAQLIHAALEILSHPGEGTRLSLAWHENGGRE